ncbi:MAG: hypothetical protein AAFQ61_01990 [Cyanobacteria bacterium J06626_23]
MSGWRHTFSAISLVGGLLFSSVLAQPLAAASELTLSQVLTPTERLVNLADGHYQFCTEPPPDDWRDGDGVCLNVWKRENWLEGYYGYPHSSRFVCLRGQVLGEQLQGEGMVISWSAHPWTDIPQTPFTWDDEGRLMLGEGRIAQEEGVGEEQTRWIVFQTAQLNLESLYRYPSVQMNSPDLLCNWPIQ